MVARTGLALVTLTLFLAAYFVVDGIFEIVEAFDLKPLRGWGWMLVGGTASIVLGLMIWRQWPFSGAWAIGILVGIKLILAGWAIVGLGAAGRGLASDAEDAVESAAGERV